MDLNWRHFLSGVLLGIVVAAALGGCAGGDPARAQPAMLAQAMESAR